MPPRKKTTRKKATRKKAPRKKASRKKVPRKKARRKKRARKKSLLHTQAAHDDAIDFEVRVMEAYGELLSYRAVARKLKVSDWAVRGVLEGHRLRVRQMVEEAMEKRVARYEAAAEKALEIINDTMDIARGWVVEITRAAQDKRKTVLLDDDGFPMTVVTAMEYLINSRLLAQVAQVAKTAHDVSIGFRRTPAPGGTNPPPPEGEDGAPGGLPDFGKMTDREIAKVMQEAGVELPPVLAKKAQQWAKEDAD